MVRSIASSLVALTLACALWLPNLHRFYRFEGATPDETGRPSPISPRALALARGELASWATPEARAARASHLRATNPEWDLMGRTFLVLALADMALRQPSSKRSLLEAIDEILADTEQIERTQGQLVFLLPYGAARPFLADDGSLFVDGEIELMMATRQIVERRPEYRAPLVERARRIERSMTLGPVSSGESYPDECWTFCNTTAMAALRIVDVLEGEDHRALFDAWVAVAKERLTDRETGLLVSSYSYSGAVKDGPEGSTLWMSTRNLQLLDAAFARGQYERAKSALVTHVLGFAYAREWPLGQRGQPDVDSGPIVQGLGVSAGSSGLAVLGASAFGDRGLLDELLASVSFAAFPEERDGKLSFGAGNPLGDAILLSAMVSGPVWSRVGEPRRSVAAKEAVSP